MTPDPIGVPRLWPGETIVCLGSGPSLTQDDVNACRGRVRVLAIKDAIRLAPWADCLYACGMDSSRWWPTNGDAVTVPGRPQFTLDPAAAKWATVLKNTGPCGIETDPSGIRTGKNSGAQAIGLAVHLGAQRILLLGYDLGHGANGQKYFYGNRPGQVTSPFLEFRAMFATMVAPLQSLGVTIVNCSRQTALECFPRMSLAEALAGEPVTA